MGEEGGDAWCQPEGELVSCKENSHGSDNLSDHRARQTRTQTVMGDGQDHAQTNLLLRLASCLPFKLKPRASAPKVDLE